MIFARKSAKRARNNKRIFIAVIFFALAAIIFPIQSHAQSGIKQFQRQFMLGSRLHTTILIIGYTKDAALVEKLMDIVSQNASESFDHLNWQDPSSELAKINAAAGKSAVTTTFDVVEAFKAAQQISKWTDGAFDVIYGGGHYKDVEIGENSIRLKGAGMQARFDSLIEGFLADLMIRYIYAATMQNAMVKVGNTFRGIGQNINGPWKIQVQDDEGTFAHHAMNLSVSNSGIATVSANQYRSQPLIDPRTNSQVTQPCRGVTVIMSDSIQAQGVAHAVYLLGPIEGQKLLTKLGNAKALIVDNAGKFVKTAGF